MTLTARPGQGHTDFITRTGLHVQPAPRPHLRPPFSESWTDEVEEAGEDGDNKHDS